jgi:GNAT superfamily N-acetyltransferase
VNGSLRPLDLERDAAAVAALFTWEDQFTWTAQDFIGNVVRFPVGKPMLRLVAELDGEVVGYGRNCLVAPNPKGSFVAQALVAPQAQGLGVGTALLAELEAFARQEGAQRQTGLVRERFPEAKAMLERRGYRALTLYYESVTDPRTFDPAPFKGLFEELRAKGYRVKALSDLPESDATDRALHAAMLEADHDAPFMDYFGFLGYEDYRQMVMGAQWYDRRGVSVALYGDEIVGLSSINRGSVEFTGEMFIEFTGVTRAHRGNGLATAMKVRALEHAKAIGGTKVRTENNTDNPAMRTVNRKLGFVENPGAWLMVKEL